MKTDVISTSLFRRNALRLDGSSYLSGGISAALAVDSLAFPWKPLSDLTRGHTEGIFNGPRFARVYVRDPAYGVPFLGSTDILLADLSALPLLSRQLVHALPKLTIDQGWVLVTCSGTVGKVAYSRDDMVGMAGSQHFLRIVPDLDKVLPGFLYAFLRSPVGRQLLVAGAYGAVVRHIEPLHISSIPIPLPPHSLQEPIHTLVANAAFLRSEAASLRRLAVTSIERTLGWHDRPLTYSTTQVSASELPRRLDALHFAEPMRAARQALASGPHATLLHDLAKVFTPDRAARVKVGHGRHGVPFFSSSEVFNANPEAAYSISSTTKDLHGFILGDTDVLIPRSGQIGGLIGRAILPLHAILDTAATEHLLRIRCDTREDAFLLWALLASRPGYLATIGTAYGSSIPALDPGLISRLAVPWPDHMVRQQILTQVQAMMSALDTALENENRAASIMDELMLRGH